MKWQQVLRAHKTEGIAPCHIAQSAFGITYRIYRTRSGRYEAWVWGPGNTVSDMLDGKQMPFRMMNNGKYRMRLKEAKESVEDYEQCLVLLWKVARCRKKSMTLLLQEVQRTLVGINSWKQADSSVPDGG